MYSNLVWYYVHIFLYTIYRYVKSHSIIVSFIYGNYLPILVWTTICRYLFPWPFQSFLGQLRPGLQYFLNQNKYFLDQNYKCAARWYYRAPFLLADGLSRSVPREYFYTWHASTLWLVNHKTTCASRGGTCSEHRRTPTNITNGQSLVNVLCPTSTLTSYKM